MFMLCVVHHWPRFLKRCFIYKGFAWSCIKYRERPEVCNSFYALACSCLHFDNSQKAVVVCRCLKWFCICISLV